MAYKKGGKKKPKKFEVVHSQDGGFDMIFPDEDILPCLQKQELLLDFGRTSVLVKYSTN